MFQQATQSSGGGAISWGFKKQTYILTPSWLQVEKMQNGLQILPKPVAPVSIHYDNQLILSKAYSQVLNGKSRHIGLRQNYVNELNAKGVIFIVFIRMKTNLADPLMKKLTRDRV